jgi:hypothetical protein
MQPPAGIPGEMISDAVISDDGLYRYVLSRRWDGGPVLPWIMLNPSTADASRNDPTLTRVIRQTIRRRLRGIPYGGACVLNAYALRSPHPSVLRGHPDPVGPDNDTWIGRLAENMVMTHVLDGETTGPVVVAWGANHLTAERVPRVMELLAGVPVVCLGVTASGAPVHPLARGRHRVPDDAPLISWRMPS